MTDDGLRRIKPFTPLRVRTRAHPRVAGESKNPTQSVTGGLRVQTAAR